MKLPIAASLLLLTVSTQAIAAKSATAPANSKATTTAATPSSSSEGLYIGAKLGDSTVGAFMGYQFNKMLGMELSYDYVSPEYTDTTTLKRSRVDASGVALFPIKFNAIGPMALYVKIGYELYTETYTVNNPGVPVPPATYYTTKTTTTGVTGGVGVQLDLSNRTSARLGLNMIGSDSSVYLNAIYRF